jgi:uncharacterized SAM-binding protein YcdF (DUF218 family)
MNKRFRKVLCWIAAIAVFGGAIYVAFGSIMSLIGGWLTADDKPVRSDAVVVLYSGVEWYPRLMEAAALYKKGFADKVVINGNRKTDVIRELEEIGFEASCSWEEDAMRILEVLGVPRDDIIPISAEEAYDTISEARIVGDKLLEKNMSSILIATSKYHTRRARFIWNRLFSDVLTIRSIAAKNDPFSPRKWWKQGRQIRWVLAEYGGWLYYFWKAA